MLKNKLCVIKRIRGYNFLKFIFVDFLFYLGKGECFLIEIFWMLWELRGECVFEGDLSVIIMELGYYIGVCGFVI